MVELKVNGRQVRVDVDPGTPLIYVLRNDLALNGPKLGCARGQCGACTIHLDGMATRSCQIPLKAAAGRSVVTLEGLGTPEKPHPVQAAFIAEQALQCGYCTNGMIMQAAALIAAEALPDRSRRVLDAERQPLPLRLPAARGPRGPQGRREGSVTRHD